MKSFQKMRLKIEEEFTDLGFKILIKTQEQETNINKVESINNGILYGLVAVGVLLTTLNCAEAVTVDSLRAPIQELKKEVFGGWMYVVKIAAIAVGSVFSVVKQSLIPFGMGGGTAAGIHFGDKWIGDGSGALI